jgi:hypothetical protein
LKAWSGDRQLLALAMIKFFAAPIGIAAIAIAAAAIAIWQMW